MTRENHYSTMQTIFYVLYAAAATAAASTFRGETTNVPTCPLIFDGRVPANFTLKQFDAENNLFNPSFVLGAGQTFSSVLTFPKKRALKSLFHGAGRTKPVEVTINDRSIFTPSADNAQVGFRRTELMIASNSGRDNSTIGVRTLHFSIAKDPRRPLNLSHEYQLVFLEDESYSTNQFVLKTGTIIGLHNITADSLTLFGNTKNFGDVLFTTRFTPGKLHNFALKLDFTRNTTEVLHSTGLRPLKSVAGPRANDISGQGQYHFGLLKKGLGGNGDSKKGFQESGINEGIIYAGIFMENSSENCYWNM
ncbi:hypothetical protein E4U42_002175 [Claviceps africana]|uniref:Glycoside hydrolase 131 catalytic N-terminal domain-containing protein n=1 Tax=Claviceps africana TaxID=83212 RepID=A0A8K0JBB4_9HYPO|nr:hypothetical protein E4U42_002175 [Claviceps africana]